MSSVEQISIKVFHLALLLATTETLGRMCASLLG